jgi:hypothetical protein
MTLQSCYYLILVEMGMHWLGYDIGIVGKAGRNIFFVTVQVNCLQHVETNTPKYRVFCVLIRKSYSVTILATDSQMLWLLLNYI